MIDNGIVFNFASDGHLCCQSAQNETTSQAAESMQMDETSFIPSFSDSANGLLGGIAAVAVMMIVLLPLLIVMDKRTQRRRSYLNSLDSGGQKNESQDDASETSADSQD